MKTRLVTASVLTALTVLHATPADAAPRTMDYVLYSSFVDPIIEQQTDIPFHSGNVVVNPLRDVPCAWDIDDGWYSIAEGTLKPGQSLSKTECVISSPAGFYVIFNGVPTWAYYSPGWYGVRVRADVNTLSVTTCYDVENYCITAVPKLVGKQWVYNSCSLAAYATDDPTVQEIPESNGGRGVVHAVTVKVTNTGTRNARNFSSMIGPVGAGQTWGGCDTGALVTDDYPFRYSG
jgi:hypothetical protein